MYRQRLQWHICALRGRIDVGSVKEYWTDLQKQLAVTVLVGAAMELAAIVSFRSDAQGLREVCERGCFKLIFDKLPR